MTKQEAKNIILSNALTSDLNPKTIRFILGLIDEIDCDKMEYEIKESDLDFMDEVK